jgi:hypothetical protein
MREVAFGLNGSVPDFAAKGLHRRRRKALIMTDEVPHGSSLVERPAHAAFLWPHTRHQGYGSDCGFKIEDEWPSAQTKPLPRPALGLERTFGLAAGSESTMIDTGARGRAETSRLESGMVFAGRYRIERLLGEGERKLTYLAHDTLLDDRVVALSVIKPDAARADPEGTRREVAALALAGSHDNIVTLYDRGTAADSEYVVMAYLSGGTLRDFLNQRRNADAPLTAEEIMRLGRQLTRALSHLHTLGLVHRDVAPANVWLDERHVAHLGDFDSVVPCGGPRDLEPLPSTSAAYQPPEQFQGGPVDVRGDLYSLGAVLFEMATGQRPARKSAEQIAERLAVRQPTLPGTLQAMICKLLAPSPEHRPDSAELVLPALSATQGPALSEAGILPWAETLPFPLAAILWHYEGEPEPGIKVDYLLKFFEALAQFNAVIQLSASLSDREFRATYLTDWFGPGANGRGRSFDLHRATFGTWVELSRRMSVTGRAMLAAGDDHKTHYLNLYGAADAELAEALTSATLTEILFKARDARNVWSGHGGVAGRAVYQERLRELERILDSARNHSGWSFDTWTLFKPGPMLLVRGAYEVTASILTGTNPVFSKKLLKLAHPVDAERLYLVREGSSTALELAPLIKVMAGAKTGQDACYFYSQLIGHEVRWVSYHFHADPELVQSNPDVAEFVTTLGAEQVN